MDAVGHPQLRERPADADHGHGTRRGAGALPERKDRQRVQGHVMLTESRIREIFEKVRRYSSADEVELLVSGGRHALTRFTNNTIHQNVAEENYVVSVRPVMGQRTARATTNKLDDASLKRAVAAAEAITRVQQP